MSMKAKYKGTCPVCGHLISLGEEISLGNTGWKHESCPTSLTKISTAAVTMESSLLFLELDQVSSLEEKFSIIYSAIEKLQNKIEEYNTKIIPLQDKLSFSLSEEEKIVARLREIQKALEESRQKRREIISEKASVEGSISKMESQMELLKKKEGELLKLKAAEEQFDALKKKLKDLMGSFTWSQFIRKYQTEDVLFTAKNFQDGSSGVLNANPMGLGKTGEAAASLDLIEHLFYEKHSRRPLVLWLTKKSLTWSTKREIEKWSPERKSVILEGPPAQRELTIKFAVSTNTLLISNYEALNSTSSLRNMEWDIVIMDEVHKLKGGSLSTPTQLWKNTRKMLGIKEEGRVFLKTRDVFLMPLSGSPIQNKPKEVWAYLHLFDPQKFASVRMFEREYVNFSDGKVNLEKLLAILSGQVIRRTHEEVGIEMPDKYREFRIVELTERQRQVYDKAKLLILEDFRKVIEDEPNKRMNITSVLAMLTRLRQINVWPPGVKYSADGGEAFELDVAESAKIDECMDLLQEIVGSGEQAVVWSAQFNEPLKEIQRRCKIEGFSSAIISGETKSPGDIERLFQQKEIDVLLCNRAAAGEGFNFHMDRNSWPGGARQAIFLDLWYNPKANEQAEDRIWRPGISSAVTIHVILAENTVDNLITEILEEKTEEIDSIMESEKLRPAAAWLDKLSELV